MLSPICTTYCVWGLNVVAFPNRHIYENTLHVAFVLHECWSYNNNMFVILSEAVVKFGIMRTFMTDCIVLIYSMWNNAVGGWHTFCIRINTRVVTSGGDTIWSRFAPHTSYLCNRDSATNCLLDNSSMWHHRINWHRTNNMSM